MVPGFRFVAGEVLYSILGHFEVDYGAIEDDLIDIDLAAEERQDFQVKRQMIEREEFLPLESPVLLVGNIESVDRDPQRRKNCEGDVSDRHGPVRGLFDPWNDESFQPVARKVELRKHDGGEEEPDRYRENDQPYFCGPVKCHQKIYRNGERISMNRAL